MALTDIPVNQIIRTGSGLADPTAANGDNSNGNGVANDGRVFLRLVASSGTPTVTVATPGTVDGNAVADITYTLSTAAIFVGPFPVDVYGSTLSLTSSANTTRITPFRI